MSNLQEVLRNLKSEKVRERQEGLDSIRTIFAKDTVVANFHINSKGDSDPRSWLSVFQALFHAVLSEKLACGKKTTSKSATSTTAQRRLTDATRTVRWLTERAVQFLAKRATKALFDHLVHTMKHEGKLFMLVALDYIKALRCLVSFTPHLDRMDEGLWVELVTLGFNVVLGDPIGNGLADDVLSDSASPALDPVDSDFYEEDEVEDDTLPSSSKKRRRGIPSTIPRASSSKLKPRPRSKRTNMHVSVSHEQVEFMSLLATLLRSSSCPILSPTYKGLASCILLRLQRFLDLYPSDTSLHHDYLMALSSTLSHLSLNKISAVENFARNAWDELVGLWGTKNKRMKEGLVAVLRVLFPFVTADRGEFQKNGPPFDCTEGLRRLWSLLDGEAESRWGVDGLSLDSLRFELVDPAGDSHFELNQDKPFVAKTFRAGWHFDAGQALTWAILELQADCVGKLFQLSESMHSSGSGVEGKRARFENPITSLLDSIDKQSISHVRAYHLQTLLFVIDRHWSAFHEALRGRVVSALQPFLSFDDGVVRSWAFLCFAAVASSEGAPGNSTSSRDSHSSSDVPYPMQDWDAIWTHAIRRANVPTVCRAACHTAHTLLIQHSQSASSARPLLTSQRILLEVETLAKDLDVQGPTYPYDSVCVFLAQCLRVVSQDVRLYRMQLEEKVLTWLVDSWRAVGSDKGKMSLHMVKDVLLLLESICTLAKRSDIVSRLLLPECQIVEVLVEESRTKVIRDFLLHAQLPPFRDSPSGRVKASLSNGPDPAGSDVVKGRLFSGNEVDLVQPTGRERKISAFLLKALETLVSEWEAAKDSNGPPTAETARRSTDMAVIALSFESLLVMNGTRSNRRVSQCACKLVAAVTSRLTDPRWTPAEKALVSLGLTPLTSFDVDWSDERHWEAMLPPGIGTGIKSQTLRRLTAYGLDRTDTLRLRRMDFLRIIWQCADVQDGFGQVINTLRDVTRILVGDTPSLGGQATGADDHDGFGPIRDVTTQQSLELNQHTEDVYASRYILEVCTSFLTVGPLLQSASGEPTRDKGLVDLVLDCADRPEKFFLLCSILMEKTRQRTFDLNKTSMRCLLTKLGDLLELYAYVRSERLQLLIIQFLDSTLDIWLSPQMTASDSDLYSDVETLCKWLSTALGKHICRAWTVRDSLARFLDRYLARDPLQNSWPKGPDKKNLPVQLLAGLGEDADIRVRFCVSVVNAHLFSVARRSDVKPLDMYEVIVSDLPKEIDDYECMITRFLSLGNIMVVSSAVRRGAYWHLLEAYNHCSAYSRHIEAVLHGVSQRMGLTALSVLFEAYASQLAYSIRLVEGDILRFPPRLLGYRNRKECAEATFRAFTPTNILNEGQALFEGHCRVVQKSITEGIRDCFGDIIGYQIVLWTDEPRGKNLESLLQQSTYNDEDLNSSLTQNVDAIVESILRTLGDRVLPKGAIDVVDTLQDIDNALQVIDKTGQCALSFRALTRYRKLDDFEAHAPNLPAFPAETVLQALGWLEARVPDTDVRAITYHVLHGLFADIQHSPLVNEQLRLINAMSLWISIHNQEFDDATLLHTVIHGATSLLEQSDLARSAQSILEWAFVHYRKTKAKDVRDPRFPDVLIRICCLAHDYASNSRDRPVAEMGQDLLRWIDDQALALSQVGALRNQITRALPAWPHPPSPQLAELYETITSETLSAVLSDHRIASNKFRLVRRLRDHAPLEKDDDDQFAKADFWRLKECIPSIDQLQYGDIDAFAALLVMHKGRISSFGAEQHNTSSIRSKHIRGMRKKTVSAEDPATAARGAIVFALLTMLEGPIASQVHVAYHTLRLITSVFASSDAIQSHVWPAEYRMELQYLKTYRRPPKTRPARDLLELLASENYLGSASDFPKWIASITVLISDILSVEDAFYAQLSSILQTDEDLAGQILPVLVHTVLQAERSRDYVPDLSSRTLLSNYFTSILTSDRASVPCLRSIVDIVLHLRHFSPHSPDALAYDKWLDIDFTLLARNAIACGAYTTALLFLELASEYGDSTPHDESAEQILYEIYSHIDEPDGFYGIKTKDLHQFLIKRFHHEKQWEKAFRFHGAALEAGSIRAGEAEGLLKAFHSFGFNHLAIDTLQTSSVAANGSSSSSAMNYRLGWRTETWDLPDLDERAPGASLYLALRAIYRERDSHVIDNIVRRTLFEEMGRLRTLGSENFAEIREITQEIMCLSQIAQWRHSSMQGRLALKNTSIGQWDEFVRIDRDFEFQDLESIMATRISLIRSVRQKEERQQIGTSISAFAQGLIDIERKCLVRLSEAARDANQMQVALNSVARAQRLDSSLFLDVSQEFASVLWLQKEERLAVQFLGDVITRSTSNEPTQKAVLLARLGRWTSEACLEKPTDIWARSFSPAVSLLDEMKVPPGSSHAAHATVYHECAIFAERQYHAILKSPDAIRRKVYIDRKTQEIQQRNAELLKAPQHHALRVDQDKAKKLLKEDQDLYNKHRSARDAFLKEAIDMYSRCLEASNAFDDDGAIRLCSLWFANFDEPALQDKVRTALNRIPSRKLVFLAHQLSARLSLSKPSPGPTMKSQENLESLVVRMCQEHPFHSLYQVYCLKPPVEPGRRQSGRHPTIPQTDRGAAAADIFDRLRHDPVHAERVSAVEQLCGACLQWAEYPIKSDKRFNTRQKTTTPFKVPEELRIRRILNLKVPVMTHHTPLDPTMRYNDCVWIERFDPTFETAGGVNLPKISVCYGTDGQKYKQLFKGEGNDDMRQDAVMEQVFELVNSVLRRDRETRRRDLSVRDYKVIPLGTQAGLLEFVGNTLPLQAWLVPAHAKFRPNDLKHKEVGPQIARAQKEFLGQPDQLVAHFQDIQKRFKPVMRHFFTERHKTPMPWFAMRLKYTRSVATTSIVGHILGLGDRHISNILLDNVSGEVVHIDLGIAFDQGKLLPIPERVPFRMTADIVDGMGTSGTQGVFQRCAEETLRVLREGSEVIMTVLEVFKHDPLHSWTASEVKVKRIQAPNEMTPNETNRFGGIGIDMESGTAEESADRALSSVSRKLDRALSVEYTVNELIAEATDPFNLASIFSGWSPHY